MKIMTGKTGTPHVTSQQFRQLIEGTVGQESYILTSGENLEPELQTNNLLKIRSGMMSHHGNLSVVDLGTYDEVTIQNGTQGMQRIDLVVNRYTQDEETGIEKNEWIVIQGTPAASNPQVPAYTEGNLQESDLVDDCPVFEVHLNGINVTEVVKLLDIVPNITELNGKSIIESGSNANGNWRKWADGTIEQWGVKQANYLCDEAAGSGYFSTGIRVDFPVKFVSNFEVNANILKASASADFITLEGSNDTSGFSIYVAAFYKQNQVRTGHFHWRAIGK